MFKSPKTWVEACTIHHKEEKFKPFTKIVVVVVVVSVIVTVVVMLVQLLLMIMLLID